MAISIGEADVTCIVGGSVYSGVLPGVEGPLEKVKLGIEEESSSSTKVALQLSEGYSGVAAFETRLPVNQGIVLS